MFRRFQRALDSVFGAQAALTSALALQLFGCGGAAQPAPASSDDAHRSLHKRKNGDAAAYVDLKVNSAAEKLAVDCDHGGYEQCNALDDDCNGIIDDECGYESGDVQITVSWDSGADIDLYVTDPSGATLFYNEKHKRSRIGGHLDHDARGDCRREQQNPRVENAYWPRPASAGAYKVELQYFSPCAKAATTTATLSVSVEDQLVGSYRYKLEPEQRIEALSFVKP